MEKHEAMKILVLIESVYPEFTLRNEAVEEWFSACGEMEYQLVMKKLTAHMRRSPYPPLMAEIAAFSGKPWHNRIVEEEGWMQMEHDSPLPQTNSVPPWQSEYLAGV